MGAESISKSLFGKARRAVLGILFVHPDEEFYQRQIARVAGVGQGAVQRELARLVESGIILRSVKGKQVYYRANRRSPVFQELRGLVIKTFGVADVLREALAPLAKQIQAAFLFGSFARGVEKLESDVDVMIIGRTAFAEVVRALGPAQERLGREINPTVYPPAEFAAKLAAGHHFLKTVMKETKVFLIGDEDELARLAGKRLAD